MKSKKDKEKIKCSNCCVTCMNNDKFEIRHLKKLLDQANKEGFYAGTICALDCVSFQGDGTTFAEIVRACNEEEVIKEIKKNGLDRTKQMAKEEFPEMYKVS